MICTNCHKEDGREQDLKDVPVWVIEALCKNWLCDDCLDQFEQEEGYSLK